jgi:hypothetical protein
MNLNAQECLLCVQVSTVSGWSRLFYKSTDNTNVSALGYYLGIILFVTYILNNLFLAGNVLLLACVLISKSMIAATRINSRISFCHRVEAQICISN